MLPTNEGMSWENNLTPFYIYTSNVCAQKQCLYWYIEVEFVWKTLISLFDKLTLRKFDLEKIRPFL